MSFVSSNCDWNFTFKVVLLSAVSCYILSQYLLTHWGRVTHICVSDLTSIGSDNGLSPGRHQAIIRTNAGILLIRPLGTNFSEFLVEIQIFSFKKMRLKGWSAKWRPFDLGLNVLRVLWNLSENAPPPPPPLYMVLIHWLTEDFHMDWHSLTRPHGVKCVMISHGS